MTLWRSLLSDERWLARGITAAGPMNEPDWRKLKLSLERPYTADDGQLIPVLHDITPEGHLLYEPKEDPSETLGKTLARVFLERGLDFFDRQDDLVDPASQGPIAENSTRTTPTPGPAHEGPDGITTTEDLFEMRTKILPQLHIAFGEMSHARDLLNLLTTAPKPSSISTDSPQVLTSTIVSKPAPISSVLAFNSQLTISGKDEALRKAANSFKAAAESTERTRLVCEKYWVDALKIRRENWGLIPAPLPPGSSMGKGADKSSKDFLISFGLEESPPAFRQSAIGNMASYESTSDAIVFPHLRRTRLAISIRQKDAEGKLTISTNLIKANDSPALGDSLKFAQQEVVEQEIFSVLVKEAGTLPTASARVSERLVVIDAAQGMELRFELIDADDLTAISYHTSNCTATCDLIYSVLHALLLRMHNQLKRMRLGNPTLVRPINSFGLKPSSPSSLMLQPIIDLLQYQVFCRLVRSEVEKLTNSLCLAGIPAVLRFDAVGEVGRELLKFLEEELPTQLSGEAILRINDSYTLRLTFLSPSSLTAHLAQANLTISSIPQLCQLLSDEVEQCLLHKICELGSSFGDHANRTWFVDPIKGRTVGRWEGCVINFRISFGKDYIIHCTASTLDQDLSGLNGQEIFLEEYPSQFAVSLTSWAGGVIQKMSARS